METAGVQSQWVKRLLLQQNLPPDVIVDLEDLFIKNKTEAGATAYKDIKDPINKTYGPRPKEAYRQARDLQMTSKPSQLAKRLINILLMP